MDIAKFTLNLNYPQSLCALFRSYPPINASPLTFFIGILDGLCANTTSEHQTVLNATSHCSHNAANNPLAAEYTKMVMVMVMILIIGDGWSFHSIVSALM